MWVPTGRTVIKATAYVAFYKGRTGSPYYERLLTPFIRYIMGCKELEHVSIVIEYDKNCAFVYQVSKLCKSRWLRADVLLKTWRPHYIIRLGQCTLDTDALNSLESNKMSLIGLILYKIITKYFGCKIPKNICTIRAADIAKLLGFNLGYHVLPDDLYKELKENADDIDCWEGGSW